MKNVEIKKLVYDQLFKDGWRFRPVHQQWEEARNFRRPEDVVARVSALLSERGFQHSEADVVAAMPAITLALTRVRHSREGNQLIWARGND